MRNRYIHLLAVACLIALVALSACRGPATPIPTTPAPTATPVPTTLPPTATPVPPTPAPAATPVPPEPAVTPVGLVLNGPGAAEGYTLFVTRDTSTVYLIDHLGRVAHTWDLGDATTAHARLLENGNLLTGVIIDEQRRIREIDPDGNILWEYQQRGMHHDFLKLPNGNVLMLARGLKTREEAIAAGANPQFVNDEGLHFERLVEIRPIGPSDGEVVWQWSTWDHLVQDFDPAKPNYGQIAEHPERIDLNYNLEALSQDTFLRNQNWIHANAIGYNPGLDQIVLSPRHYNELWIIDHSATTPEAAGNRGGRSGQGGGLLYRWGNPKAYGLGDESDQQLFWGHNTHWIEPGLPGAGNILVFNNGDNFELFPRRFYSSVDEIVPPLDGYVYQREPAGTSGNQREPAGTSGNQREPAGTSGNQREPAGTIPARRAGMDLYRGHAHRLLRPPHFGNAAAAQRQYPDLRRPARHVFPGDAGRKNRLEVHQPGNRYRPAAPGRCDAPHQHPGDAPGIRYHVAEQHLPRLLVRARLPRPARAGPVAERPHRTPPVRRQSARPHAAGAQPSPFPPQPRSHRGLMAVAACQPLTPRGCGAANLERTFALC